MFIYVPELKRLAVKCHAEWRLVDVRELLYSFLTSALDDTPQPLYPWERAPVPRRVVMPQGPSARVRREKLFPPLGSNPEPFSV